MRYVMRQKLFSLSDSFQIKDESGNDAFVVAGRIFSFGHQLSFQDLAGNELVAIKQQLLSWGPTYEISKGGQPHRHGQKGALQLFQIPLRHRFARRTRVGRGREFPRSRVRAELRRKPDRHDLQAVVHHDGHLRRRYRRRRGRCSSPGHHGRHRHGLSSRQEIAFADIQYAGVPDGTPGRSPPA